MVLLKRVALFLGVAMAAVVQQGLRMDYNVNRVLTEQVSGERSLTVQLQNYDSHYTLQLQLGSNKQPVVVDLDTGSADLWVVSEFGACEVSDKNDHTESCFEHGTYNLFSSASSKDLDEKFFTSYGDASTTRGDYMSDDVSVGGKTLKDLQFGVGHSTSLSRGVLGLGYPVLESTANKYVNFPAALKAQGLIDKIYYSLFPTGPDSGTIIFGGIDHTKYVGDLIAVPFVSDVRFSIDLNTITMDAGHLIDVGTSVVLDSGSNMSFLPSGVIDQMADFLNAQYNKDINAYVLECDAAVGDFAYQFDNNARINVSYSSLLGQLKYADGSIAHNQCYLKVYSSEDGPSILGENFLTQAYVVFDLEDKQALLAQAKL